VVIFGVIKEVRLRDDMVLGGVEDIVGGHEVRAPPKVDQVCGLFQGIHQLESFLPQQ